MAAARGPGPIDFPVGRRHAPTPARGAGDTHMTPRKELTAGDLAALFDGAVEGDPTRVLRGPAALDEAGPDEVSFLAQAGYAARARETRAGAVVVGRDVDLGRDDLTLLRCDDPERAFTEVVVAFAPEIPDLGPGVHATAAVDPTAELEGDARVGPHATVGPGARLAAGVRVHAGVTVGAHCRVGEDTALMPRVVLYPRTEVGARCVVHAGAVLGSDGFGFHLDGGAWRKTPQVGRVVVEDDVEIGANVAIDCARFGATRIRAGAKLDNLIHIAHNCEIGRGSLVLAQVGIAGSTVVEDGAIIAGQVGIAGHLRIGAGARIAGHSGVTKSVPAGEEWFGYPAGPSKQKMRALAGAEKAGAELKALKARIEAMEQQLASLRTAPGGGHAASDGSGGGSA